MCTYTTRHTTTEDFSPTFSALSHYWHCTMVQQTEKKKQKPIFQMKWKDDDIGVRGRTLFVRSFVSFHIYYFFSWGVVNDVVEVYWIWWWSLLVNNFRYISSRSLFDSFNSDPQSIVGRSPLLTLKLTDFTRHCKKCCVICWRDLFYISSLFVCDSQKITIITWMARLELEICRYARCWTDISCSLLVSPYTHRSFGDSSS